MLSSACARSAKCLTSFERSPRRPPRQAAAEPPAEHDRADEGGEDARRLAPPNLDREGRENERDVIAPEPQQHQHERDGPLEK